MPFISFYDHNFWRGELCTQTTPFPTTSTITTTNCVHRNVFNCSKSNRNTRYLSSNKRDHKHKIAQWTRNSWMWGEGVNVFHLWIHRSWKEEKNESVTNHFRFVGGRLQAGTRHQVAVIDISFSLVLYNFS